MLRRRLTSSTSNSNNMLFASSTTCAAVIDAVIILFLAQGCGRYRFTFEVVPTTPAGVDVLVSPVARGQVFQIIGSSAFVSDFPDVDPLTYDPFECLPASPVDAFDALCASPRVLLHKFSLPVDGCQALANAILSGTASAVCDGSYDPDILRGTSAFILSPNTSTTITPSFLRG